MPEAPNPELHVGSHILQGAGAPSPCCGITPAPAPWAPPFAACLLPPPNPGGGSQCGAPAPAAFPGPLVAANAPGARSSRRAASGACNVTAALPSMPSAAAPVCPAAERGSSGSPLRSTAQTTLVRNARSARLAGSHGPYGLQGQRGRVRSAAEHVHVPGPTPADGAPDFVHPVAPSRGGSHTLLHQGRPEARIPPSRRCIPLGHASTRLALP